MTKKNELRHEDWLCVLTFVFFYMTASPATLYVALLFMTYTWVYQSTGACREILFGGVF